MTSLTLKLEPNDDKELTCLFCRRLHPCDLAVVATVYGCKSWQGVHSDCAEQARVKP